MFSPSDPTPASWVALLDGRRVSVGVTRGRRVDVEVTGGPGHFPLRVVVAGGAAPVDVHVTGGGLLDRAERVGRWWHDPQTKETTIVVPGVVE